jgi:asparagine synthase (glutamine-hydrolysing)
LVANGEIYNFIELREELKGRGHVFATGSDCETILHLYEELGSDCLVRLRGMFAFAIHDVRRNRLLIARDRLGEKPLYLASIADGIVFSSELAPLVRSGAVPFSLDLCSIHDYLMWGFVPEPRSAIKGTRKLPAGSILEVDLACWQIAERTWWRLLDAPPLDCNPGDAISRVLDEISGLVVRSDVPVGVALSGGVDSALVASMASQHALGVKAITVGYPGRDRHDETEDAAATAKALGLSQIRVELSAQAAAESFAETCGARDEPNADISGPGYLAIMKAARDHGIKVLLFGQGGDELFWGYPWTKNAVRETIRKSRLLRGEVGMHDYLRMSRPPSSYSGAIDWLLSGCGLATGAQALRRDRKSSADRIVFWDQRPGWRAVKSALQSTMSDEFLERTRDHDSAAIFTGKDLWARPDLSITDLLVRTYLLSNGLDQADRLAMSCGVECRLPLVDYRLAETAVGLRKMTEDWRLRGKSWLMPASRSRLPAEVFERRKRGFTPPWRGWTNEIFKMHGPDFPDGLLVGQGIICRATAQRLMSSPIDFLGRPHPLAMPLLMLEAWCRSVSPSR